MSPAAASGAAASSSSSAATLLLVASNDTSMTLWDVNRSAVNRAGETTPLPVARLEPGALHAGGIFGMHTRGGRVLTASKVAGTQYVSFYCSKGGRAARQNRAVCIQEGPPLGPPRPLPMLAAVP